MILVITNAVSLEQKGTNLTSFKKTVHKCFLINLYSEYSLSLFIKNLNNNKYTKDE